MRRREFVLALSSIAWSIAPGLAQTPRRLPRVGILWHGANEHEEAPFLGPLKDGLAALGYVDGQTIQLEHRYAHEDYSRFGRLARELVEAGVDMIVGSIPPAVFAAREVTKTIPILSVTVSDPVALGLAQSLARPGGNVTGMATLLNDLVAKQIELLRETNLSLRNFGVLINPNNRLHRRIVDHTREAMQRNGSSITVVEAGQAQDLKAAISSIAERGVQVFLVPGDGFFYNVRREIIELALANRLLLMSVFSDMVRMGAFLSYGADVPDLFRRTAVYVDRIIKGANPADLPMEQPTKFTLAVNMRTARAIGVEVPTAVLARADEVIE
jgi:putative ABC transport system substrate-binding protein